MNRILLHIACTVAIIALAVAAPAIAPLLGASAASLLLIATVFATLPQFHPAVFARLKRQKIARLERLSPPGWVFGSCLCAILIISVFGSVLHVAHLLAALTFVTTSSVMLDAVLPLPRDLTDTPSPSGG